MIQKWSLFSSGGGCILVKWRYAARESFTVSDLIFFCLKNTLLPSLLQVDQFLPVSLMIHLVDEF